ncbi:MAG: hypothetical protein PHP00_07705 [Thiotrichaceae bacterium]|nr:hypothetical protein [Thiotrichaceae bacterium]
MNQDWFEMSDIRRKSFNKSAWIPLKAVQCEQSGKHGYEGYKDVFFGASCAVFPVDKKDYAEELRWRDMGLRSPHSGYCHEDGTYFPADAFIYENNQGICVEGIYLVLVQPSVGEYPEDWHLHQDVVLTLGLYREGDIWICPESGYIEVARLKKSDDQQPVLLEMKTEYLKDYLCARNMGLYISSYYGRDVIVNDMSFIDWKDGEKREEVKLDRWEGRIIPIHEGGYTYGTKTAVHHFSRTDIDETCDVPDLSEIPADEHSRSESWEFYSTGKKLYRILGEFWHNEWVEPGKYSSKIRRDETPPVFFIIDVDGKMVKGNDLCSLRQWLWFKSDVIMALSNRRGGSLTFYTRNTGSIACSTEDSVHFGMNSLGYINVYAKDIGLLPNWQQQIWNAHNITPDGGVSDELLASQVRCDPTDTKAPETLFCEVIKSLNEISQQKLGFLLFNQHEITPELLLKVHRFRATDDASLFALAKDIARLTADSLNAGAIQKIVSPSKGEKWGSLKSLEKLLASKVGAERARNIMSALAGVYDLRLADAHLPSDGKTNDAFKLVRIDRNEPVVLQAYQMLDSCVSSLSEILKILEGW